MKDAYVFDEQWLSDHFARSDKFLDSCKDFTTLLLTSHLLLEETLFRIIAQSVPQPQYIERANLNFARLAMVARACAPAPAPVVNSELYENIWSAVMLTNTIRNKLAHKLEPQDLDKDLQRLFSLTGDVEPLESKDINDSSVRLRLGRAFGFMSGVLDTLTCLTT